MYELNAEYLTQLEELAVGIQDSPALAAYLNSEEEVDYNELKSNFEPSIAEIYQDVAQNSPLQLIALEQVLMDPVFEGLFLPKLLGYVVLRGNVNNDFKYIRPQEHFKDLILYFVTANAFFFLLLHADNELMVVPFGILLLVLLFVYLVRIQSKFYLK